MKRVYVDLKVEIPTAWKQNDTNSKTYAGHCIIKRLIIDCASYNYDTREMGEVSSTH